MTKAFPKIKEFCINMVTANIITFCMYSVLHFIFHDTAFVTPLITYKFSLTVSTVIAVAILWHVTSYERSLKRF